MNIEDYVLRRSYAFVRAVLKLREIVKFWVEFIPVLYDTEKMSSYSTQFRKEKK